MFATDSVCTQRSLSPFEGERVGVRGRPCKATPSKFGKMPMHRGFAWASREALRPPHPNPPPRVAGAREETHP